MPSGRRRGARWAVIASVAMAMMACPAGAGARWYTYRGCRLIDHPSNDGDSFHVRTRSAEYIFRLYFVDAPECDTTFPERVAEQAAYWGIETNRVLEVGRAAAAFAREFLSGSFTIHSKREDARGQSTLPRFYALVSADGRDLAEALVARGLARIHGMPTSLPDGTPPEVVFARLRALEASARRQGLGAWEGAREPPSGKRTRGAAKSRGAEEPNP